MADHIDPEEFAEDGDHEYVVDPSLMLPPPPRTNWKREALKYLLIPIAACGIGYGIVCFQNSDAVSALSAETALPNASGGPPVRRGSKGQPIMEPGLYYNDQGKPYISTDGEHFNQTNGSMPANAAVPTFVHESGKGFVRVK